MSRSLEQVLFIVYVECMYMCNTSTSSICTFYRITNNNFHPTHIISTVTGSKHVQFPNDLFQIDPNSTYQHILFQYRSKEFFLLVTHASRKFQGLFASQLKPFKVNPALKDAPKMEALPAPPPPPPPIAGWGLE